MTHRAEHEQHLKWAYLDGEMSAAEAAAFADDLSTDETERLLDEASFESAVAERLAEPVACPDDVWRLALARVNASPCSSGTGRGVLGRLLKRPMRLIAAGAAACLLAVSGAVLWLAGSSVSPAFLELGDPDMGTFASRAEVVDGPPSVRAFLERHAPKLAFDPSNTLEHEDARYRLLGAREDDYGKEKVIQLLFDCEGQPAKVVIARKSGGAAEVIGKAVAKGSVRASYPVGDSLVAVVGNEDAGALLGIVAPPAAESPTLDGGACQKAHKKAVDEKMKAPELTDVVPETPGVGPAAPSAPSCEETPPSEGANDSNSTTTTAPPTHQDKTKVPEETDDAGLTLI